MPTIIVAQDEGVPGRHVKNESAEANLPGMLRLPIPSGDYAWDGKRLNPATSTVVRLWVGLERKRLVDLVRCVLYTHHHLEQLARMREIYDVVYLLVEGIMRPGRNGLVETQQWDPKARRYGWGALEPEIRYDRLLKSLETIRQQMGVYILRTMNYHETCRLILSLAEWWETPVENHESANQYPQPFGFFRAGLVPRIAKELRGIGVRLSGPVGREFSTPAEMVRAEPERWLKVPGIGPTLMREAVLGLHGQEEGERILREWEERRRSRKRSAGKGR